MSDSLPTETLQERQGRLQELIEFTENCKKQLQDVFESLGLSWDLKEQEPLEQCPYDPDHRVPGRTMEKHKASCRLKKMGYSAEEQAEMYDPSVCYENTSVQTFTMDKSTQHQVIMQARSAAPLMKMEGAFWQATGVSIREDMGSRKFCCCGSGMPDYVQYPLTSYPFKLKGGAAGLSHPINVFPLRVGESQYSSEPVDVPQNHKRAVCDLTPADRLALYDHVVCVLNQEKQASSSNNEDLYVDLVSKLQKDDGQNEPKTHLELMAEMRDYKRRRQSYRAKNVHITKKSYTEVIREVINVHSEELARQWKDEAVEEEQEEVVRSKHSSQRHRVDERRSASSESHHSHSRRHRSRERSRDRERRKKKRKERDSRSPNDRHHDRKKKKKKKRREDREEEK